MCPLIPSPPSRVSPASLSLFLSPPHCVPCDTSSRSPRLLCSPAFAASLARNLILVSCSACNVPRVAADDQRLSLFPCRSRLEDGDRRSSRFFPSFLHSLSLCRLFPSLLALLDMQTRVCASADHVCCGQACGACQGSRLITCSLSLCLSRRLHLITLPSP